MKVLVVSSTLALVFTVVLLTTAALGDCDREREQERQRRRNEGGGRRFEDLEPRRPKQYFRSEGGQIETWSSDEFGGLRDANMAAAKFTLNPRGFLLPHYIDNHDIKVVTAGSARMGLILPLGDRALERNVYRVSKGDVIAVLKGVPTWWYNDGDNRTEIVAIAETSSGEEPGYVQTFHLAGGKGGEDGSLLRGFDRGILARAWDVDEGTVSQILDSQKGASIVRVREGIEIPEVSEGNGLAASDYIYRLQGVEPDYRAEGGGQFHVVNRYKLPVLKDLDLAMTWVKLEPNAIGAPDYLMNAHQVMYIVRGSGRIQIIRNNGEKALDTEIRQGSLVVVPRLYPVSRTAGSDGLDYLSVLSSDMPFFQFLAGRNSVLNGIPSEVVALAFSIDKDLERKVRERRSEEAFIFPPSGSQRERRSRRDEPRNTSLGDDASSLEESPLQYPRNLGY